MLFMLIVGFFFLKKISFCVKLFFVIVIVPCRVYVYFSFIYFVFGLLFLGPIT